VHISNLSLKNKRFFSNKVKISPYSTNHFTFFNKLPEIFKVKATDKLTQEENGLKRTFFVWSIACSWKYSYTECIYDNFAWKDPITDEFEIEELNEK